MYIYIYIYIYTYKFGVYIYIYIYIYIPTGLQGQDPRDRPGPVLHPPRLQHEVDVHHLRGKL